jgi:hypothetical protein
MQLDTNCTDPALYFIQSFPIIHLFIYSFFDPIKNIQKKQRKKRLDFEFGLDLNSKEED